MRARWLLLAAFVVAARCSPDQHAHPVPPVTQTRGPVLASQDRDFLERAAQGNNAEQKIGETVNGRAESAGVAQLGRMMVADHAAANVLLAKIADQHGVSLPTSLGDHQAGYDRVVDRKGQPFDEEFMRVMIEDHQQAVRMYREAQSTLVDPDLRAYVVATLPKIEVHLAHATSLSSIAEPPQQGTRPPTPDATQLPPRSTAAKEPSERD